MIKMLTALRSFRRDATGVAAVEFALFAPVLMAAAVMMAEVGFMAFDKMKLTSGVRSASQYVLTGGKDDIVITSLISSGSGFDAADLSVAVTLYCNCAVDDTDVDCYTNCADDDTPRTYHQITAKTISGRLFRKWPLTSNAEVRTR